MASIKPLGFKEAGEPIDLNLTHSLSLSSISIASCSSITQILVPVVRLCSIVSIHALYKKPCCRKRFCSLNNSWGWGRSGSKSYLFRQWKTFNFSYPSIEHSPYLFILELAMDSSFFKAFYLKESIIEPLSPFLFILG